MYLISWRWNGTVPPPPRARIQQEAKYYSVRTHTVVRRTNTHHHRIPITKHILGGRIRSSNGEWKTIISIYSSCSLAHAVSERPRERDRERERGESNGKTHRVLCVDAKGTRTSEPMWATTTKTVRTLKIDALIGSATIKRNGIFAN